MSHKELNVRQYMFPDSECRQTVHTHRHAHRNTALSLLERRRNFEAGLEVISYRQHRERKCADTIGTVPVPWAGHCQYEYCATANGAHAIFTIGHPKKILPPTFFREASCFHPSMQWTPVAAYRRIARECYRRSSVQRCRVCLSAMVTNVSHIHKSG